MPNQGPEFFNGVGWSLSPTVGRRKVTPIENWHEELEFRCCSNLQSLLDRWITDFLFKLSGPCRRRIIHVRRRAGVGSPRRMASAPIRSPAKSRCRLYVLAICRAPVQLVFWSRPTITSSGPATIRSIGISIGLLISIPLAIVGGPEFVWHRPCRAFLGMLEML